MQEEADVLHVAAEGSKTREQSHREAQCKELPAVRTAVGASPVLGERFN